MGLFTLCSCLKTKESYDRWITRRVWGFRHQISKANIGKLQENFVAVQDGCKISYHEGHHFAAKGWFRSRLLVISQSKADFAALRNWPSAWSDQLPMAVTPSFQLRIVHRLKHWIANFPSFETTYSMHELSSKKCSKSVLQWLSSRMLHVRFLFASPPCIPDLLMAKDFKASKLWFFMFLSFPLLCHGFQRTLLNLGLLWWSNY